MPRKTWDTQADYDGEWSLNAGGGVRVGYSRVALDGYPGEPPGSVPCFRDRALGFQAALGWTPPGPSIAIFASGFGWTVEALEDLGYTRIVAIDTSAWIQSAKGTTEESDIDAAITAAGLDPLTGEGATIKTGLSTSWNGNRCRASGGVLNEDGQSGASRGRIKQALGLSGPERIDWVITESMIESFDDAEVVAGSNDLHIIGTNVVHLVPTSTLHRATPPAPYNWKTLEEWSTLLPLDILIECGSYRALLNGIPYP